MTRSAIAALPLFAALGLAACVQSTGEAPDGADNDTLLAVLDTSRACFTQREIRGYSDAPRSDGAAERIILDTGLRERFVLETLGPCPDLDFSMRMALAQRTFGSVCTGDVENLVFPSGTAGADGYCPVRVLGRVPRDWDD